MIIAEIQKRKIVIVMCYENLLFILQMHLAVTGMQSSSCYTGVDPFGDSVLESQWNDTISVDDDTSECWTQPWDLPAGVNCADHSDISDGSDDVTATSASKNVLTECLNSKG